MTAGARVLIVTDAWHPQVNGVVRTLSKLAEMLAGLGVEVKFITPDGFHSVPMPFYPDILLALATPRQIARQIAEAAPETGAPITNRVWNSSWLATTLSPSRTAESVRPARSVDTMSASIHGATIPNGPGTDPPATTCDTSAVNVATEATTAPRATRGVRERRMRPVCQVVPRPQRRRLAASVACRSAMTGWVPV